MQQQNSSTIKNEFSLENKANKNDEIRSSFEEPMDGKIDQ